jgi:TusA-related sulfurtransferase
LVATDPQTPDDVGEFCLATTHELLDQRRDGEVFSLLVRKGA